MQTLNEIIEQPKKSRPYLKITPEQFKEDFLIMAHEMVEEGFSEGTFQVNDKNKEVINQVYYYLTGSKHFKGNLKKGLLLAGPYGTGKTTILKIVSKIIFKHMAKIMTFMSCVNLHQELTEKGIDHFKTRPLILDEIGREIKVVNDYGTKKSPFNELLTRRYDNRSWTFGTSNYDLSAFDEMYGGYIGERIKEMFNILILGGESYRK